PLGVGGTAPAPKSEHRRWRSGRYFGDSNRWLFKETMVLKVLIVEWSIGEAEHMFCRLNENDHRPFS
ncbi:hypothetical protein A2U01_0078561, partial [Trifolium medium]|nr:hypothetical protein [Trifolium medium]